MKSRIQIIAEVGVNHDGKIIKAKKLIDVAKKGNADFVKFFEPKMFQKESKS